MTAGIIQRWYEKRDITLQQSWHLYWKKKKKKHIWLKLFLSSTEIPIKREHVQATNEVVHNVKMYLILYYICLTAS